MSDSTKQIPHTTVESTISHKSNLLTTFHNVTTRHSPVIIRTVFLNQHCTYREAVFLTRLVEAEIVSPYHGILINTGVGNPTVLFYTALGAGKF